MMGVDYHRHAPVIFVDALLTIRCARTRSTTFATDGHVTSGSRALLSLFSVVEL